MQVPAVNVAFCACVRFGCVFLFLCVCPCVCALDTRSWLERSVPSRAAHRWREPDEDQRRRETSGLKDGDAWDRRTRSDLQSSCARVYRWVWASVWHAGTAPWAFRWGADSPLAQTRWCPPWRGGWAAPLGPPGSQSAPRVCWLGPGSIKDGNEEMQMEPRKPRRSSKNSFLRKRRGMKQMRESLLKEFHWKFVLGRLTSKTKQLLPQASRTVLFRMGLWCK